jgi:hypothetical protein
LTKKNELIDMNNYDLIDFGTRIGGGKHCSKLHKFVDKLPNVQNKKHLFFQ